MGFAVGETVGPYALLELIGPTVGITTVYKAYQEAMDRYVALIVLHSSLSGQRSMIESFEREVRRAAKLEHSNVLTVYGFYKEDGRPYMATNFVEGPTLKHLVSLGPLTPAQVLSILKPACSAVDYAHSQGVLHLDIRPTSILVTPEAEVVMTGFGVAGILMRQKEEEAPPAPTGAPGKRTTLLTHLMVKMTKPGEESREGSRELSLSPMALMRAPEYIAPEQAMGRDQNEQTDVYSLGIVAFESLAGRPPFTGDTPYAVIQEHLLGHTPALGEINPLVPKSTADVILKAMQRNPEDRYRTVGEFINAFEEAVLESQVAPVPLNLTRQAIVDELIPALPSDISVEEEPIISLHAEGTLDESSPAMSFKDFLDSSVSDLPSSWMEPTDKIIDFSDFLDELRELSASSVAPRAEVMEEAPPSAGISAPPPTPEPVVKQVKPTPPPPAPKKIVEEKPAPAPPPPRPTPPPPKPKPKPKKVAPVKAAPKKEAVKEKRKKEEEEKPTGNILGNLIWVFLFLLLFAFLGGIALFAILPDKAPVMQEQFIALNEFVTGEEYIAPGEPTPTPTIAPDSAEWWMMAARDYVKQGDLASAGEAYRRALDRNSTLWDAYSGLGDVLLTQGMAEEAYQQYQIVLSQQPQNAEIMLKMGEASFQQKQWEQAAKHFREAQETGFEHAMIHAGLAQYHLMQRDGAVAYEELEQALRLDPELPEGQYVLGIYYKLTGQPDYAREEFKKVLNSNRAGAWIKQEAQQELQGIGN